MKNKLSFISIFTLCIALSLTACGGKQSSNTASKNTQTEAGTEASGKSDSKLDDLYQQENQLFADHADAWNKAFGMMNKSDADPNGNYADYLAGTIESNNDSFTDEELKTLNEDIETIRKIEEQIAELQNKNTSSDDNKKDSSAAVRALVMRFTQFSHIMSGTLIVVISNSSLKYWMLISSFSEWWPPDRPPRPDHPFECPSPRRCGCAGPAVPG